ncbi:MAG: RNA 3'-terminal phosphate cyclase [Euryarchaeota archaeon]|nr:RNA 3'-terminal phosphate cyclase [Euryarchaeota archaeon]
MLEIDSSRGEGGGQMVRTSVAMSAITVVPTRLTRIRENRPTNGLSKQHTTAVDAVAQMTGSKVTGSYVGSSELTIEPGTEQLDHLRLDIGTAGSISLVMQAVLLAARNHKRRLTLDITGGTNVMWAPPVDSYQMVLFPLMRRMGIEAEAEIRERGFYPLGGGRVVTTLEPIGKIRPLMLTDLGEFKGIRGRVFVQHLPERIGTELADSCRRALAPRYDVDIEMQKSVGNSRGAGMVLVAEYENGMISSNVLTSRGHTAEQSGEDVANDLITEMGTGATVDSHTADQLLLYMAMAEGHSKFVVSRISRHLLSQMDTLESFLDVRFGVERKSNGFHFSINPGGCS